MIVGIEESQHEPSDAMHNPSQPFEFLSKDTCLIFHEDTHSPTHYPCDLAETFRVIRFSIHSDEWKSFQCHHQTALRSYALSWKPCQGDSLNLPDHRYIRWCCSLILAKSDSLPHAYAQALKVNHSTSRLLLLNKNVIGQKAQVHVKFSNFDNRKLLHHQRYSKSNKESSSGNC
ncbi:hypothetical protein Tco_1155450 [Tanacetum coccineum]